MTQRHTGEGPVKRGQRLRDAATSPGCLGPQKLGEAQRTLPWGRLDLGLLTRTVRDVFVLLQRPSRASDGLAWGARLHLRFLRSQVSVCWDSLPGLLSRPSAGRANGSRALRGPQPPQHQRHHYCCLVVGLHALPTSMNTVGLTQGLCPLGPTREACPEAVLCSCERHLQLRGAFGPQL